MIYNVHYDVCAILIVAVAMTFTLTKKGLRLMQNRILLLLLLGTLIAAVFDIATCFGNSYVDDWSFGARDLMNYGYLIFQNVLSPLFCIYTISVCGMIYRNDKKNKILLMTALPYGVDLVLLCLNPFLKWVFYYDADKLYTHGPAFYALYVSAFLYLAASSVLIFKHGKRVERGSKIMCVMLIVASVLSVVIQIFIPHVLLSLCVESLSLLGILLVIDNEDEIIDSTSKCFNRRFFIQTNTLHMGNGLRYHILVIRIMQLHFHTATLGMNLTNKLIGQVGDFLRKLHKDVEVYCYDNGAFALLYFDERLSEEIMERVDRRFQENWVINETNIQLDIDKRLLGVGEQVTVIEELLLALDVDSAKEEVRQEGKEKVSIFDYRRELSVEKAIRRALATDGFIVKYQPVWDAKRNMITRAEVLLQLEDEELGVVSPSEFMPIAEKKGASIDIGKVLLQKACSMYQERKLEELGIEVIEIKATKLQCMNTNLSDIAIALVAQQGVDAHHFGFQVSTETLIDNQKEIISNLNKLKQAGFRLSIDDYGYQAMSLLDLFQYPIDCVRIDKHFLWQSMDTTNITILFKNTVRMLHEMQLLTIVEGVEDVYQKELAVEMNCDLLQGFFFSKSVGEEGFYRYCRGFNLR